MVMGTDKKFRMSEDTPEKFILIMKALDSAGDAIGIADPEGRHFYQNYAFSELFEFETAQELVAQGSGFPLVQDKSIAREITDSIMAGEAWAGALTMVTKNGRVFPAFQRVDVIRDDGGNVIGFISVITDWTERRRAETLLLSQYDLAHAVGAAIDLDGFLELCVGLQSKVQAWIVGQSIWSKGMAPCPCGPMAACPTPLPGRSHVMPRIRRTPHWY